MSELPDSLAVQQGKFISVEGIEGVGKSTVVDYLVDYLQAIGFDIIRSREPGGCMIAEEIRQLLLKEHHEPMHPRTELLLMFASRSQHMQLVILPALQRGAWVVCDRFVDASYAYQGFGHGIDLEYIAKLDYCVLNGFKSNLTLLLDAPVEVGFKRLNKRGQAKDRIENQSLAFFERVRAGYLERAKQDPDRFCIIDAGQSLLNVQNQVQHILDCYIKEQVR